MIALTGIVLEALVAVLLIVTIIYCIILDRRIRSFKSEQLNLSGLVAQLSSATTNAEVAVAGLKITADEADGELDSKLKRARSLSEELAFMVETGNNLAGKLADPALRGQPLVAASPPANVAYLRSAAEGRATEKTEPAFAALSPAAALEPDQEPVRAHMRPTIRPVAAEQRPVAESHMASSQTRSRPEPEMRPSRPAAVNMREERRQVAPQRAAEPGIGVAGQEVRQTLAQALRYAR